MIIPIPRSSTGNHEIYKLLFCLKKFCLLYLSGCVCKNIYVYCLWPTIKMLLRRVIMYQFWREEHGKKLTHVSKHDIHTVIWQRILSYSTVVLRLNNLSDFSNMNSILLARIQRIANDDSHDQRPDACQAGHPLNQQATIHHSGWITEIRFLVNRLTSYHDTVTVQTINITRLLPICWFRQQWASTATHSKRGFCRPWLLLATMEKR